MIAHEDNILSTEIFLEIWNFIIIMKYISKRLIFWILKMLLFTESIYSPTWMHIFMTRVMPCFTDRAVVYFFICK